MTNAKGGETRLQLVDLPKMGPVALGSDKNWPESMNFATSTYLVRRSVCRLEEVFALLI